MVIIWGSILNIKQKNWISTNIVYYGWFMLILHPMIFHHIHHCPIFNWFNHSNHLFLRWTQVRSSHPIRYRWGSKQSPSSPSKRGSLSACQSCAKGASGLKETSFGDEICWMVLWKNLLTQYTETVNWDRKEQHQTRSLGISQVRIIITIANAWDQPGMHFNLFQSKHD